MSKSPKNWWNSMKIANIDREIFHIFWTTWGISIKFSGKMWLMIILKVRKNHSVTLPLENTFFEKPQRRSIWPPSRFRVNINFKDVSFVAVFIIVLYEFFIKHKLVFSSFKPNDITHLYTFFSSQYMRYDDSLIKS